MVDGKDIKASDSVQAVQILHSAIEQYNSVKCRAIKEADIFAEVIKTAKRTQLAQNGLIKVNCIVNDSFID
jgi:hypothetical protein